MTPAIATARPIDWEQLGRAVDAEVDQGMDENFDLRCLRSCARTTAALIALMSAESEGRLGEAD